MPVILHRHDDDAWLDPGMTNVEALSDLLKPFDAGLMRSHAVSSRVNQVQNDDPECARPVEPESVSKGAVVLRGWSFTGI
jgi:putative SOS response-associated peptidase YedK